MVSEQPKPTLDQLVSVVEGLAQRWLYSESTHTMYVEVYGAEALGYFVELGWELVKCPEPEWFVLKLANA